MTEANFKMKKGKKKKKAQNCKKFSNGSLLKIYFEKRPSLLMI